MGKATFAVAQPYLKAATPILTHGAEQVGQSPWMGHAIAGGVGLVAAAILDQFLLRGAGRRLLGRGAGTLVSAATAPSVARRTAQSAAAEAASKAGAARLAKMAAAQQKTRVATAEALYKRAQAALKADPTGPVSKADVARFRQELGAARKELTKLKAGANAAAKASKTAALAQQSATGAAQTATQTGRRWLRRLLFGGGAALAGGAILDVMMNPAEAAEGGLTPRELAERDAQRAAQRQRRRRPGGFFGGARFERPARRPNYLTTRSRVEIFDLPADRATAVAGPTLRDRRTYPGAPGGAASLVPAAAVSPITSLKPRDPRYGQRRIAESLAGSWFRGLGDEPEARARQPVDPNAIIVRGTQPDPNNPWFGRDMLSPDAAAERRRGAWDLGSTAPPPDAAPAPAPDIFDDAGGMAGRPVPIDDAALLAEIKRTNMLLQRIADNRAAQPVRGTAFFDRPSYVNT